MVRPTSTWKNFERRRAALWGGQRIPASGNGGIKGDVRLDHFLLEAKYGRQVSAGLYVWMNEAARDAETERGNRGDAEAPIPVLVLGRPRSEALVVLREDDFLVIARKAGLLRPVPAVPKDSQECEA